eukprot:gene5788-13_t
MTYTVLLCVLSVFAVSQATAEDVGSGDSFNDDGTFVARATGCIICSKNNKNKPASITFRYHAGQGVNMNSQGSKAYGDLTSTFAESATITINGQTKSVTDDDIFTIQGSFSADSKASINSQSVNFHTSCSVTLQTGDRYGPLEVLAGGQCPMPDPCGMHGCCPVEAEAPGQETTPCTDAGCNNCYQDPCGVYGCCADGQLPKVDYFGSNCPRKACYTSNEPCPFCPEPSPPPQVQPPSASSCTICSKENKNKPTSLTILYTAGQGMNQNEQGTKSYGDLTATYPSTASISSGGFSATVGDGDTFTVTGSFSSETTFYVGNNDVTFHTSCSVTLKTGDRFGPFTILGGGQCAAAAPSTPSCWPYGCCGGTDVDCVDESCSNCCNPAAFDGCTRCCEDGSVPPCCTNMPEFVEDVSLKGQEYTGACTESNELHVETAHALKNYIESLGEGVCKGNNGDVPADQMIWSVSVDGGNNFYAFDNQHSSHDGLAFTDNCCNVNQKPFSPTSPQTCCPDGSWSDVELSPQGFVQCGAECTTTDYDDDIDVNDDAPPLCVPGSTCTEARPDDALLELANAALCDGFDDYQCPSLTITFRCCDPCDPDAKCVDSNGAFYMEECPTCTKRPSIRERPEPLILEHFGECAIPGQLPAIQNFALQAWFSDNAGMVCVSANELSKSSTPMDNKLYIVPTSSITVGAAAAALCADEECPSVPVEFECCDPCDPTLCKSVETLISVADCCPHHPKLQTPASSHQEEKAGACSFSQLPESTDFALREWYEEVAGSVCVSQNNPDASMIWS